MKLHVHVAAHFLNVHGDSNICCRLFADLSDGARIGVIVCLTLLSLIIVGLLIVAIVVCKRRYQRRRGEDHVIYGKLTSFASVAIDGVLARIT